MTVRSIVCDDVSCIIDLCHMPHVPISHNVLYQYLYGLRAISYVHCF